MKKVIVTTSWDDGHILDLKLAELLQTYALTGTFYISPKDREIPAEKRLSKEQVKRLSKEFEIGAHSMTHPRLSQLSRDDARKEIIESKKVLEDWTEKQVTSFCYPGGNFNEVHKQMIKEAGFSLARTVDRFATNVGDDWYALPTTVQAFRHWSDSAAIFREVQLAQVLGSISNWDNLAIGMFEKVFTHGGVFHLWGHSWEIEKNNDWPRLERVFKHIARRPEVKYLTNQQLI